MTECQICVFSWIIILRPKKRLMVMMMTDSDNRGRDGIEMRPTDQNLKLNSLKTRNSNKIKFRLHEIQLDVSSPAKILANLVPGVVSSKREQERCRLSSLFLLSQSETAWWPLLFALFHIDLLLWAQYGNHKTFWRILILWTTLTKMRWLWDKVQAVEILLLRSALCSQGRSCHRRRCPPLPKYYKRFNKILLPSIIKDLTKSSSKVL